MAQLREAEKVIRENLHQLQTLERLLQDSSAELNEANHRMETLQQTLSLAKKVLLEKEITSHKAKDIMFEPKFMKKTSDKFEAMVDLLKEKCDKLDAVSEFCSTLQSRICEANTVLMEETTAGVEIKTMTAAENRSLRDALVDKRSSEPEVLQKQDKPLEHISESLVVSMGTRTSEKMQTWQLRKSRQQFVDYFERTKTIPHLLSVNQTSDVQRLILRFASYIHAGAALSALKNGCDFLSFREIKMQQQQCPVILRSVVVQDESAALQEICYSHVLLEKKLLSRKFVFKYASTASEISRGHI